MVNSHLLLITSVGSSEVNSLLSVLANLEHISIAMFPRNCFERDRWYNDVLSGCSFQLPQEAAVFPSSEVDDCGKIECENT